MNTTEWSEHWRRLLLAPHALGFANETVLLDRYDIGVGPQPFEVFCRKIASKPIDDIPLVGDPGGTVGHSVDMGFLADTVLEGHNVPSAGDGLLGLAYREGRMDREYGENMESEGEEDGPGHVSEVGRCGLGNPSGTLASIYGNK